MTNPLLEWFVEERARELKANEDRKRLNTLISRAAVRGIALYLTDGGITDDGKVVEIYLAIQGLWQREMHSMDEVDAFLVQFEGTK